MCRVGGPRCDKKWDNTHRERYNARRRVARDTEKAKAARDAGDQAKADMYEDLASNAHEIDEHLSTQIANHEATSSRDPRLPEKTITERRDGFIIDDAPVRRVRDIKAVQTVLHDCGMPPGEAEAQSETLGRHARKLRHPRVALLRDDDGTITGTLTYEDDRGPYAALDIYDMRLTGDRRGHGGGSTLINHIRHIARSGRSKERGMHVIGMLDSAKPFYSRLGADVVSYSAFAHFDTNPESGRCPECGQWVRADGGGHQCKPRLDQLDPDTTEGIEHEETARTLQAVANNPDADVTVYYMASTPKVQLARDRPVALALDGAKERLWSTRQINSMSANPEYEISSTRVKASQLRQDGSPEQWTYDAPEDVPPLARHDEASRNTADTVATPDTAPPTITPESVVRTDTGEPLVVHHGSSTDFDTWDPEFTGTGNDTWGSGFYFTQDAEAAKGYGDHTKDVTLDITNPIRLDGTDTTHIDERMSFTADQSAQILKSHPDIYRQPDDDEEMNPLGDYAPDFWNKDHWSREEMDQMIDQTARDNFDGAPWSSLEGMFPGGQSDRFRRAVRDTTGHDGVVTTFDNGDTHWIAWFPEQIHDTPQQEPEAP